MDLQRYFEYACNGYVEENLAECTMQRCHNTHGSVWFNSWAFFLARHFYLSVFFFFVKDEMILSLKIRTATLLLKLAKVVYYRQRQILILSLLSGLHIHQS